jgi:hypothetical protein
MTRTVGSQHRDEFVLDPAEAWRRGRRLDAMLATASLAYRREVIRATHETLNRLDDERRLAIARRLNVDEAKAISPRQLVDAPAPRRAS